mgnify:CR=1 FL=1
MATLLSPQPKYQVLKESLLGEIRSMAPGARLESVKGIMQRFSVSQATVDKAMGELKRDGLVESRVGNGHFVAEAPGEDIGAELGTVDLIAFGSRQMIENPGFHSDLIAELSHVLGAEGRSLRTTVVSRTASRAELIHHIEQLDPQAVLTMDMTDREIPEILVRRGIPYVLITPYWPADLANSFRVDSRSVARLWVNHLSELGHSKIAYLHGIVEGEYNRDMSERLQFLYEAANRAGLVVDPDLLLYAGFSREEGYKATRDLLTRNKEFTAMIINDHIAAGVYDALRESGRSIPDDVSVIGTDDLSWASHMAPPLTTVRISRNRLATMAVSKLEEAMATGNHQFAPVEIPVGLIQRKSTGCNR